jgi:hypothetical protein
MGLGLIGLLCAGGAPAQEVSSSNAPDAVSVTIYRDPNRGADEGLRLDWLNGYALITETRQIRVPAGEGEIRFEGVAGGILPESAIVTGLPDGVIEKNQDAWLLSPASLLDRSLGKRVHVRRTSTATGAVREEEAVIRTGADGAVVLQTQEGFEALRCSGLPETIVYSEVPEGLSAKPTLSVRTRSDRATQAAVTLSYLATGFDWQANYVATLSPAGDRMHLFAWVTLANGDETSFVNAGTQTVAGRPNREHWDIQRPRGESLELQCWPEGTTSEGVSTDYAGVPPPPPPPPPLLAPSPAMRMEEESIVVTGSRMTAVQEDLGDLKLYRIQEPVTVAANSQKQVAMLEKESVKVASVFRLRMEATAPDEDHSVTHLLATRNRDAEGLGLPLPAGGIVIFGARGDRPILLGESSIEDKAVGEEVEIKVGEASGVNAIGTVHPNGEAELVVTNDQSRPIRFEAQIDENGGKVTARDRLTRKEGDLLWTVTVPANGRAVLRYRHRPAD